MTASGAAFAAPDGKPIKIGTFLSVTGPASFLGDPELKTLEHWVGKINDDGGVLGRPLELVHYDTSGNAGKARTFVKRLINSDRVDVIVGGSTTGTTMAAVPLVERSRIAMISLAGGIPIIDPVKKWVFKTPHTDRMAARKILKDMQDRGFTKVGLISGSGGFGQSGRTQTLEAASEFDIEIVADESYNNSDTDMTAQLTNIANTSGVQAILNFGFGQGPAIVTRNYSQLGLDLPFYQSHGVASEKYIELAGDAAEGVRLPAGALLVASKLPDGDPQKDVAMAYKQEYESTFNESISQFGGHAYDGLMIAVKAIEAAGSTDRSAIRDEIEKTDGFVGVGGVFNMSADDHMGLDLSAFRMLEIHDGAWTLID
ncbi:extracellular ligand-binding receptor [Salinisphaera dokdonensis CL-ES53]|uniref:Extracellular ligand-binding receptor n=1 Tax=Salinisphaera dokdonensis CL-ES53 TaxID=1304272 RepID=A0ABV2AZ81_9GAMM